MLGPRVSVPMGWLDIWGSETWQMSPVTASSARSALAVDPRPIVLRRQRDCEKNRWSIACIPEGQRSWPGAAAHSFLRPRLRYALGVSVESTCPTSAIALVYQVCVLLQRTSHFAVGCARTCQSSTGCIVQEQAPPGCLPATATARPQFRFIPEAAGGLMQDAISRLEASQQSAIPRMDEVQDVERPSPRSGHSAGRPSGWSPRPESVARRAS